MKPLQLLLTKKMEVLCAWPMLSLEIIINNDSTNKLPFPLLKSHDSVLNEAFEKKTES